MGAIIRRELSAYFRSPIGYVFCAVYIFFSALFFRAVIIDGQSSQFPQIYSGMMNIDLLILPVLTMRLFSEERRQKTDQILITSPISIFSLVMGKFIAAFCVYAACTLFTLVYAVVLSVFVNPGWALIFGNIIGALLFGGAFIAIGMFISSLTESQIVAAIGSFFISTLCILIDVVPMVVNNDTLSDILKYVSFVRQYTPFTEGLLSFSSVIFFLSIMALFIFLTMQSIEKRRWA